jgi:hypothetical protein
LPADSQSSESELEKSVEMGERNPPISLRQLFALDATSAPSCIAVPDNATRFKLKPSSLNNLPCFRGSENDHVEDTSVLKRPLQRFFKVDYIGPPFFVMLMLIVQPVR